MLRTGTVRGPGQYRDEPVGTVRTVGTRARKTFLQPSLNYSMMPRREMEISTGQFQRRRCQAFRLSVEQVASGVHMPDQTAFRIARNGAPAS